MTLASGTTFGPYQILEALGRGGMATVFRAYEPGLDRYVALKVLPREFLHDEGFAERFSREAKVVARLEHPNIIPIHNFGIEETTHTPWMAMRLISGGALSGFMKKSRLTAQRTTTILHGVAEALDYAHGRGVVHRDVKPQNILLDEAERVYLADFGIAKMVESTSGLTATGMISGTPQYMAPEQAMASNVDRRADIYALGIVAYEMLTGRVPFSADTPVAVLMKHVSDPIPIPSPMEVPEPLVRALLKCLAKRPEDRWQSSVAFVNALDQALGQVAVIGDTPSGAPTTYLPADYGTPRSGVQAPDTGSVPKVKTGVGITPPSPTYVAGPYAPPVAYPAPPTPPPGTYPGTYPGATPPGMYPPPTPAPGTYPATLPPPTQPGYRGTIPPGTYPGLPYGTLPGAHPPPARSGKGLILGLVAGVVLAGILGTIVLVLLIRPRAPDVPERTPVTMRTPDIGGPSPMPVTPTSLPAPVTPTTMAPVVPSGYIPPVTRPVAPNTPTTAPPPSVSTLPPTPTTPAPEPTVHPAPPAASFPGAGKVDMGEKFYEKTLAYSATDDLAFDGHVGAIKVPTVHFALGEKKTRFHKVDTQRLSLRAVFPAVECAKEAGEWEYSFQVDLLDEAGQRLDRITGSGSCENQTKVVTAEGGVLKTLIPAIKGVKIRMQAAKD